MTRQRVIARRRVLMSYLSRSAPVFRGGYDQIRRDLGYRSVGCLWADLNALRRLGYLDAAGPRLRPNVIRILVPFVTAGGAD